MDMTAALNKYFTYHPATNQSTTDNPMETTPSKPTIKVMLRNVYGEEKIYPACGKAEVFVEMLGQKTLTYSQVEHIKKLGFDVEVVTSYKAQYL
jgi:hypothetical protein